LSTHYRLIALLAVAASAGSGYAQAPAAPSHLADYVRKPDQSFAWKLVKNDTTDAGTLYELSLVSQTWHDIPWDHAIQVFVPKGVKPQATMVLWNQGGRPSPGSSLLGLAIAERVKAPVAFLYGIPKQPLFNGKTEDALIAETFVRYLETKDPSWPLLFPMAKSLVKAMDALQAFAREKWQFEVTHFVVTGASKRGWTSWLTAASGDPRVKAIAPMVIDTLNMPVQAQNQVKAFGKPSEMIRDYVERKLVPVPDTPEAKLLWTMIDPWVYREKLTLPKMLIFGTNDPYWPQDALNTYWDDLKGEKHVLYVPNAGHDLREVDEKGKKQTIPLRAVNTLAAFSRSQIFGTPIPALTWKHSDKDGKPVLEVNHPGAKTVRLWEAKADTRDFRQARWKAGPTATVAKGEVFEHIYQLLPPEQGFAAYFAEAEYELDGLTFTLSTQIRILEAKK
jgi:PhoPQ-activated pathogenicity-related protein